MITIGMFPLKYNKVYLKKKMFTSVFQLILPKFNDFIKDQIHF